MKKEGETPQQLETGNNFVPVFVYVYVCIGEELKHESVRQAGKLIFTIPVKACVGFHLTDEQKQSYRIRPCTS